MASAPLIGYVTPYRHDEPAVLACSLALASQTVGSSSLIYSPQGVVPQVYLACEHLARNWEKLRLFSQQTAVLVWFDVQPALLRQVTTKNVKHVLVALWHRLQPEDVEHFPLFSEIVCPHPAAASALAQYTREPRVLCWDVAEQLATNRRAAYDTVRLAVLLDSRVTGDETLTLLNAFRVLLHTHPQLYVSILYDRAWDQVSYGVLQALQRDYAARLTSHNRQAWEQRAAILCECDLAFCPSLYESSGLSVLQALAAGCVTLTYDTEPSRYFTEPGYNTLLLPAEQRENWLGASTPIWTTDGLVSSLSQALANYRSQEASMRAHAWTEMLERRVRFAAGWERLLTSLVA